MRAGERVLPLTLTQAARRPAATGQRSCALSGAGKLSATHDEATGAWLIEPAELFRLYPPVDAHASTPQDDAHLRNGHASAEIGELRARLDAAEARISDKDALIAAHERAIEDLRRRLDRADERLTVLLTDQRGQAPAAPASTRRLWWPWRRDDRDM